MITVLRQLPRKIKIITAVRLAAMTASRTTPLMAARTKTDWSANGWIFSCGGSVCCTRERRVRMPLTTLSVDASQL